VFLPRHRSEQEDAVQALRSQDPAGPRGPREQILVSLQRRAVLETLRERGRHLRLHERPGPRVLIDLPRVLVPLDERAVQLHAQEGGHHLALPPNREPDPGEVSARLAPPAQPLALADRPRVRLVAARLGRRAQPQGDLDPLGPHRRLGQQRTPGHLRRCPALLPQPPHFRVQDPVRSQGPLQRLNNYPGHSHHSQLFQ